MGLRNLIQLAVFLAVVAASTGQLPRILNFVRIAQIQLIQESQASKWGRPILLLKK